MSEIWIRYEQKRKKEKKTNDSNIFISARLRRFSCSIMFQQRSLAFVSEKEGVERITAQCDGADFDSIFFVMPPDSKWQRICHQQHTG